MTSGSGGDPPDAVGWAAHGGKHVAPMGIDWTLIVKGTARGPAKYAPGTGVERLERDVWQHGTPVVGAKNWKVMEFPHEIGASKGKPSRWMRVEESGGTIHGHPITEQEYKRLTQ